MSKGEIASINEQFYLPEHRYCSTIKIGRDATGETVIGLFRNGECVAYHHIAIDDLHEMVMRFRNQDAG